MPRQQNNLSNVAPVSLLLTLNKFQTPSGVSIANFEQMLAENKNDSMLSCYIPWQASKYFQSFEFMLDVQFLSSQKYLL